MLWIEYDKTVVVAGSPTLVKTVLWTKANGALRESMYRMTTSIRSLLWSLRKLN
jgi:hypothetical protein